MADIMSSDFIYTIFTISKPVAKLNTLYLSSALGPLF